MKISLICVTCTEPVEVSVCHRIKYGILESLIDFIRFTFYDPESFIPLHDPRFIGNEKKCLNECINSNFVSNVGVFVDHFEQICAEYTGSKYAVAAMNGTATLT